MITLICSECGERLAYGPITISGIGEIEAAVEPCECSKYVKWRVPKCCTLELKCTRPVFDSAEALRNERGET